MKGTSDEQEYEPKKEIFDRLASDLDVRTMGRADAFHSASQEEKGPSIADDPTRMDLEKLMEVKR
jgi:hypothetical protein